MTVKRTPTLLVLFLLCAGGVFSEPRGWGLGVGVFDDDFGAQVRKDFMFGKAQQYAIDLQGGLFKQDKWTTRLDADFHYNFRPDSAFSLYPLAGVNLAIQNKHNRTGFNLGGGATIDLNSATRLFLEAKYVIGDWDGFALTTGIYF